MGYNWGTLWSDKLEKEDRHIQKRGKRWYYMRRVPKRFAPFDARQVVKSALKTNSIEVARFRRDALEAADDDYWVSLLYLGDDEAAEVNGQKLRETLARRYRSASARAIARGFVYAPVEQLVATTGLDEILDRIGAIKQVDTGKSSRAEKAEAEALLGAIDEPDVSVSEAFEMYCKEIAIGDLINKSPKQKKLWMKTKRRGIAYFIDVVGDKPLTEIDRKDGLAYYNWWAGRLQPKAGKKVLKANTANRDIGNMRLLYSSYFKHIGQEDRQNPFRNLSFKDSSPTEVPAFEDEWVRSKILIPSVFDGINKQAISIIYALIEIGCRPSEIANLMPDDIKLNVDIPYWRHR